MPIPSGSFVELDAQIVRIGNTSIEVSVDVYREDMYQENRVLALSGRFVFVSLNKAKLNDGVGGFANEIFIIYFSFCFSSLMFCIGSSIYRAVF